MKKKTGFEKFHKVKSGSALKEQIRQEKKKITKERKEYFEAKRQEKYGQQSAVSNQQSGLRNSESGRKTTNHKLQTKNPGLQTATAPQMPLNKYIAHSGVCSRRDAAELIKSGKVKLNGEVITEPGRKVTDKDVVIVGNKKVYPVADLVYILLNKPKDYLTTTDDPQQRKTVLDLIVGATKDRVYPVGRLDRNTSGVLLLTNDGELAQKLTHPSNEIKKVYAVTLDKPLERKHFDEILKGVALEDGMAHVDMLAYTDAQDKTQIGVEIHSGRNRIVRRIFEKFGYDVKGLDRVMFAGLTKKNVNRGRWRYLNEKEVRDLKYFKKGKG
jgi:23S rRNA pseudouridine2605 synthase